ncbi:MAG: acetyl-CoA carboxylase biotin carboxyl carrier protein subunit [Bacteroidales bacterium]|nr:acetyl-CoA carboxylase biotin carboxyl carrier protein subunit [Bacteroidales bacterium]
MKVRRKKSEKKSAEVEPPVEHNDEQLYAFTYEGAEYMTLLTRKFHDRKPYSPPNPKLINAFIPGTIVKVNVKEKEKIKKGESLLSLKAMKMNNDILSSIDGTVKKVYVKKGDVVVKNQLLVELR